MGLLQWFAYRSPRKQKRDSRKYDAWAFPYGDAQQAIIQELLKGLFPDKLIKVLCQEPELASAIHSYPLIVKGGSSIQQAQVCSGGVDTEELDPETLESRLHPGLYMAGELIDIDGTCGGYNLQWAWSSGAAAGLHAAKEQL